MLTFRAMQGENTASLAAVPMMLLTYELKSLCPCSSPCQHAPIYPNVSIGCLDPQAPIEHSNGIRCRKIGCLEACENARGPEVQDGRLRRAGER